MRKNFILLIVIIYSHCFYFCSYWIAAQVSAIEKTEKEKSTSEKLGDCSIVSPIPFHVTKANNVFNNISQRYIGRIDKKSPLYIPPCDLWYVSLASDYQLEKYEILVDELSRKSIPGVVLYNTTFCDADLKKLSSVSSLRALNIQLKENVTDKGLKHIASMNNLCYLDCNIGNNLSITNKGIEALGLLKNLRLLAVSLSGNNSIEELKLDFLDELPELEILSIKCNKNIDLKKISMIAGTCNLKSITLWNTRKEKVPLAMKDISQLNTLNHICVNNYTVNLKCISELVNLKRLSFLFCNFDKLALYNIGTLMHLRELNIINCNGKFKKHHFQFMSKLENLHTIDISSDNDLVESCIENTVDNNQLNTLSFTYNENIEKILLQSDWLSTIKELHLYGENVKLTNDALKCIGKCEQLQSLEIDSYNISHEGFQYISNLEHLKTLSFSNYELRDAELQNVTEIKTLKSLHVSVKKITDKDMEKISSLTELESLSLNGDGSNLSDVGFKHITKISNLQFLHLLSEKCLITNKVIRYISQLKQLEWLILYDCYFGSKSVKNGFSKIKNLRLLRISYPLFAERNTPYTFTKNELQSLLPNCIVLISK